MAPSYRPYAAEHGRGDAAVSTYGKKPAAAARWWATVLADPEMKRRGRVASYKAFAVEGKVKASIRRGIRWVKSKCSRVAHR